MVIAINDYGLLNPIINRRLKDKTYIIDLVLEITKHIMLGHIVDDGKIVFDEKCSRIFISTNNGIGEVKYFSFLYPFKVIYDEGIEEDNWKVYNQRKNIQIDFMILDILRELMTEQIFTDKKEQYGVSMELEGLIEQALYNRNKDRSPNKIAQIEQILLELVMFESSYIRFDEDSKGVDLTNEKIHPLYHFDIYYNQKSTFKIGVDNKLIYKDFISLLSKEKKSCKFLRD